MIQAAVTNSWLTPVGSGDVYIHTLQFADDILLFFDGSLRAAEVIKIVLDAFSVASGLRINFAKSRIIPVHLEPSRANDLVRFFGCSIDTFPVTYLGLPLSPKSLRKVDYLPLIEKIGNRLAGWKGRLLSRAGRLVLTNSVLSSVPSFFCSAFRIPIWALRAIDRIRRGFFWKGKTSTSGFHCAVNWNQVCRPKAVGGLGIRNLAASNMALLMKSLWHFYKAKDLPWVRLLRSKHYTRRLPCAGGAIPARCAPLWKGVLSISEPFHTSISCTLGDGSTAPFWHVRWLGDKLLRNQFPALFKISSLRNITVKRWMLRFACRSNMGFGHITDLDATGQSEAAQLSSEIENITLSYSADEVVWRWSDKGRFCSQSAYRFLVFDGVDDRRIPHLWSIKVPLRIKIFLWLTARNRLLTADRLINRGWHGPSICSCCCSDEETLDHLLFRCSFARSVWSGTLQDNHIWLTSFLQEPGDLATRWKRIKRIVGRNDQAELDARVAATCWEIWMERNRRIFENRNASTGVCGRSISSTLALLRATRGGS